MMMTSLTVCGISVFHTPQRERSSMAVHHCCIVFPQDGRETGVTLTPIEVINWLIDQKYGDGLC